jgi:hypothetical protein
MAYVRRKAWEHDALALAIVGILTMNGMAAPPPVSAPVRFGRHRWVSPQALMAAMGVKL